MNGRCLPTQTTRAWARWVLIAITGGLGIFLLFGMGMTVFSEWNHPHASATLMIFDRPYAGDMRMIFVEMLLLALFVAPLLIIAYSLLRREPEPAVELLAWLAGLAAFGALGELQRRTGLRDWMRAFSHHGQEPLWKPFLSLAGLGLQLFLVGSVYRGCRRFGQRYLLNAPATPIQLPLDPVRSGECL